MRDPRVGDMVVCYHPDRHWLVKGQAYEVSETFGYADRTPLIGLAGVKPAGILWGVWRFRPNIEMGRR